MANMNMKEYLRLTKPEDRELLAKKVGSSVGYFIQIAGGHRQPSPMLAKRLDEATGGVLPKETLRPDIYA